MLQPTDPATLIGYARCSTETQDVDIQRAALLALGIDETRLFTDVGVSARARERPGLDAALDALQEGSTLVAVRLDRLARSVVDTQRIVSRVIDSGARLAIGNAVYDPGEASSAMFFGTLAMFAELETSFSSQVTKEGMVRARAEGKLKGRSPKLSAVQSNELRRLRHEEGVSIPALAAQFGVSRPTVYRELQRGA